MHKKIGKILCILPIDFYFFIFLFFLTAATLGGCSSLRFFSSHLSIYAKYSLLLILQPPYLFFITLLYQKNKAMSSGFSIKFLFMEQRIFSIPCSTFITCLQNIQHPLQQFCQEFHSLLPLLPVAELYWLTGLYQKLNCKCLLSV